MVNDGEVDRASNTVEMRSSLIVLGSREGVVKGGIEWSIILVFVGSKLVSELELKSLNSDLEHDQCSEPPRAT